jgi:CheY-like chemotaxis protein
LSQPHALIIDDNANNLSVLGQMLAMEGVTHTAVLNPNDLSRVLSTLEQVDIVFLDLEMPTTDGYAILAALNQHERFQSIPIVACTVHVNEISTARQQGFHSFLAKPLDSDQFPDQLARILRGERVWKF